MELMSQQQAHCVWCSALTHHSLPSPSDLQGPCQLTPLGEEMSQGNTDLGEDEDEDEVHH